MTLTVATRKRGRRLFGIFAGLGLVAALGTPVLAVDDGQAQQAEGCPAGTTLLVTFTWDGAAFAPDGGAGMGVSVTGDADWAFFTSTQAISAIVVQAGAESRHIALDLPETVGSISPHNYEVFGGATTDSLGFCVGAKATPESGSSVSIELAKTAECATPNDDGTATLSGAITVRNHGSGPARLTSALDTILGPNAEALDRTQVDDLIGLELTSGQSATVAYVRTFDPMGQTVFTNFIEVTIERADTGAARHKIYNARADFELCAQVPPPTTPPPTPAGGTESPAATPRQTVLGGTPMPTPAAGRLPDTAATGTLSVPLSGLAFVFVASAVWVMSFRRGRRG